MESPRIHGGAEERSSCESGWTMYIEDTFHGNHHSDVVIDDDDVEGDDDDVEGDDEFRAKEVDDDEFRAKEVDDGDNDDDSSDDKSDDSMTSDASSWPSTQPQRNTKNHATAKNSNAKQGKHKTESRACERFSDKEEESELKARTRTTAASRVQSRSKVTKSK